MKKIISLLSVFIFTLVFASSVSATENWTLSVPGPYTITFACTSVCSGVYPHTFYIDNYNSDTGEISGHGIGTNDSQTWNAIGDITEDAIEFTITYISNLQYIVKGTGGIDSSGAISGSATSPTQGFDWIITPTATFNRKAEIVKPEESSFVLNSLNLEAYLSDNDEDFIDWAVRKGTCAAGTGTVLGNVDGHNDFLTMAYNPSLYSYTYTGLFNVSGLTGGMYCFIFNPREDSGETDIRSTREFYIAKGHVWGGGQLIEQQLGKPKDDYKISFGGNIWKLSTSVFMGDWEINFHNVGTLNLDQSKFHSTSIQAMNFLPGTGTPAMKR